MPIRHNIWKLCLIRFFHSLIPAYVIERLYWAERGMTVQLVIYTEILYAVSIVLLEIPTGILADRRGRKPMIVLASLLGCAEFLILLYAHRFWHFAVMVLLAGLAHSAASGSVNALLYDSLKQAGKSDTFERIAGRLNVWDNLSIILAALLGSALASRFGLRVDYEVSLGSMIVATIFAFSLMEPARHVQEAAAPVLPVAAVAASLQFFRRQPDVAIVMGQAVLIGAAMNFIHEFWQLYAAEMGIPLAAFGLLSSSLFLMSMPGNFLAHAWQRRFRTRTILIAAGGAVAAGYLALSVLHGFAGLAGMLLVCLAAGAIDPLTAGYLHHRVDSSVRATADSFQSLGTNAVAIVTGLAFGPLADRLGLHAAFGFIAATCAVGFLYFLTRSRRLLSSSSSP